MLGVDGCRGGWVGVVLAPNGDLAATSAAGVADLVTAAAELAGPPRVVGVDMPLHLSTEGWRACDLAVRAHLGPKRSSVFPVPPAPVLALDDYADACAACRELTGKAFSRQLWMLRPKILELEAWWTTVAAAAAAVGTPDVREVHPETSFSLLAGAPILARKTSAEGRAARRDALARHGLVVGDDVVDACRPARSDDVLDAAAVAWTARRVLAGTARPFPDPPVVLDGEGPVRVQAVWA